MKRYAIAIVVIGVLFAVTRTFAYDGDTLFSDVYPEMYTAPSPVLVLPDAEIVTTLPATGGIPTFTYRGSHGAPTVTLPPGQLPTFTYQGKGSSPTVTMTPDGKMYYSYSNGGKK